MEGKPQAVEATATPAPARHSELWPLTLGLAALLITVKVILLPFPVSTLGEFGRWLIRLSLVISQDLCFLAGFAASCGLVSLLVRRWRPAQACWRPCLYGMFYLAGLYSVFSLPMYKVTLVPFTIRLVSFAGGPFMMASSIGKYVTWQLVLALALAPIVLTLLPRWTRRISWTPISHRWRLPLAAAACLGIWLYGAASQAYINSHWTEPSRWERRIAQCPHTELIGSCVEELLKDQPFTANLYFKQVDVRDFTTRESQVEKGRLPAAAIARRPKNVLVVLLESTAAEYLSLYGAKHATTPHLDQLTRNQGVVFDNLYVQVPNSCKSIVALTGSVDPRLDWQLIVRDSPNFNVPLITEVLAEQGYRTCMAHSGFWSWRNRDEFFRKRGVQTLIDAENLPEARINSWGVSDKAMFKACIDWIDAKPDAPFFLLAYTIETHHPYAVPKVRADFDVADPEQEDYLNAIRATDETIAWLMQQLQDKGLADDTLVVITSDHGESFGQHNQREHMFGVYEPNVHLPLVLLHPGLNEFPRRIESVREQIDIAPTILELLGFDSPRQWQGRSLFRGDESRPAYFFCVGNTVVLGLRDGKFKYHYYVDSGQEELFDLSEDPAELQNLAAQHADRCADYRRRVGGLTRYQREFLTRHGAP